MSGEEQNRSFYKETFEEIPVPEVLAEKVGKITVGDVKNRRNGVGIVMRKVVIAAAVLAALFVGSNGIAYAMTGSTWLETLKIRIGIEGEEYEVQLEEQQLRNGETIYIGEVETKKGDKYRVKVKEQGQGSCFCFEMAGAEVWTEEGRIYILDDDLKIDITEGLEEDGHVSGTYEVNGILKGYKLWKTDEGVGCWIEILHDGEKESFYMRDWLPEGLPAEKTQEFETSESQTPEPNP